MKSEEASKKVTKVAKKVKKETMKTEEKAENEPTEKFYFPEGSVDTIYSLFELFYSYI